MINRYLAPKGFMENIIIIERSKFIGYVNYVTSEKEAKEFIDKIKKQNSLATHNCYAYITDLGQSVKFYDDGEPTGTAGMSVLDVIKNKKLVNCVVVVTRYFGGIKLGAGGLVRAYTACASEVLQKTEINEFVLCREIEVISRYENYAALQNYINLKKLLLISTIYSENIIIRVAVFVETYQETIDKLTDYMQGKIEITAKDVNYYPQIIDYHI